MFTRPARLVVGVLAVALLGAVALRLLLAPSSAAPWTAEAQFWVTVMGVFVTVAAVLVALFGPQWHAARLRPQLSLKVDKTSVEWAVGSSGSAVTFWLRLANARGRDTARDVEVFVSTAAEVPEQESPTGVGYVIPAEDEPLLFGTPMSGRAEEQRVTVPAGHSRWLAFADAGEPGEVAAAVGADMSALMRLAWRSGVDEEQPRARLRVDAPGEPVVPWLGFGVTYPVEIVVTGSNFDALRFRGEFGSRWGQDEGLGETVWCGWVAEPSPVAEGALPLVDEVMQ